MKVKIGMQVGGEVTIGVVIAMTKEWCIYQDTKGREYAEPWDCIMVITTGPDELSSPVTEGPDCPMGTLDEDGTHEQ
jgi:hypothetical protein